MEELKTNILPWAPTHGQTNVELILESASSKKAMYGLLPPISQIIQVRQARHAGNCWGSTDGLQSDIFPWAPKHGQTNVELILEAASSKTATVRPLTFHLTNHPSKTRKTCWELLGKYGQTFK